MFLSQFFARLEELGYWRASMHILITGGTGFIGSHLCEHFLHQAHQVSVLTRSISSKSKLSPEVHLITELNENAAYDVIINLAGEPLFHHRWNEKLKKILKDSRVETTQKIIDYIKFAKIKPKLLISGSAVGFYGNSLNTIFTENSPAENTGFAHELCRDWEATAMQANQYGVRVCISRTGIVLGKNGGAIKQMQAPTKFGLGAILGDGQQWTSWIHMSDILGAMDFLIQHPELNGPFNLTAPNPVTNKTLTKTLAKILHRPSFLKIPAPIVKILFGEMGEELLLASQNVLPEKLTKAGYVFKYTSLEPALKSLFTQSKASQF